MRLTNSLLAAAVLILTLAPAALADSFQFAINSSVQEIIENTADDNVMGIYTTPGGKWGDQGAVHTSDRFPWNTPFSNISFSVPTGNFITSARMELIVPLEVEGTGNVFFSSGGRLGLHPPDTDNPVSIAATLGTATSSFFIDGLETYGFGSSMPGRIEGTSMVFDLFFWLDINGNQVSSINLQDVLLAGSGGIYGTVNTQGYNFASYVGGTGQATVPYTLEVTGTYSPVPEPSSFALLGTGLLGLAGFARRKFLSQS